MSPAPESRALAADPLWVPLLTHYRGDAPAAVDHARMAAHVASLRPSVRQFLLAGSTGDCGLSYETRWHLRAVRGQPSTAPSLNLALTEALTRP